MERGLRVLETDKTFFKKITNTIGKLLIPTKVGFNSVMISIKRNNVIKAYLYNEEDNDETSRKKYEDTYALYLESIDKYIMDSVYKKVKNDTATEFERNALANYYEVTHLKETEYLEYKYRKQKYLIDLDYENLKSQNKEKVLNKYEKFYSAKMDTLYKGLLKHYSVQLADNLVAKDREEIYNKIFNTLEDYIGTILPIKIKNDAKCAALAENKYGSLKDYKRSIFIGLGTGIGGAVIVDDKLLDTGDLPGCEIGHMIIQKDGLECKCGKKGCFEKYASMKAFKTNLRKELNLDETTRGEELLNILRNNNENNKNYKKIEKIVNDYIEYLSIGISNLINIFEPEAIGIGGSFVYFEDVLLNRLYKKIIEGNLLFNKRDSLIIKLAVLGNDAGIIGASLL